LGILLLGAHLLILCNRQFSAWCPPVGVGKEEKEPLQPRPVYSANSPLYPVEPIRSIADIQKTARILQGFFENKVVSQLLLAVHPDS
jgi:hypothetical protein